MHGVIEKLIRMDKAADVAHRLTSTYASTSQQHPGFSDVFKLPMSSIHSWFKSRLRERLEKPSEFEDGFFQYSGQSFADARPRELFFLRRVLSARAGRLEVHAAGREIGPTAKIRGALSLTSSMVDARLRGAEIFAARGHARAARSAAERRADVSAQRRARRTAARRTSARVVMSRLPCSGAVSRKTYDRGKDATTRCSSASAKLPDGLQVSLISDLPRRWQGAP